jgi:O-acetyl-ADP-ribose deacetylase (regulator of RNase III)
MKWLIKNRNILDEPSDILIVSANVGLTLAGGVAADLLSRYGPAMQLALHLWMDERNLKWVNQGEIHPYSDEKIPHKAILHAVAVDGFYRSTIPAIERLVRDCLRMSAERYHARRVSLSALATGYGNLSLPQFAEALKPLTKESFDPMEEICICLRGDDRTRELAAAFPEATLVTG